MSTNKSGLVPHPGFYRLILKGIIDSLCTVTFHQQKIVFELETRVNTRDFTEFIKKQLKRPLQQFVLVWQSYHGHHKQPNYPLIV